MKRERARYRVDKRKNLLLLGTIVLLAFVIFKIADARYFKVKEDTLIRKLSLVEMLILEDEPTNINKSWDESEIPNFLKEDLEYCEKKELKLKYRFEDTEMRLDLNDKGEWILRFYSPYNYWESMYEIYKNFSMYRDEYSNIVFYAYNEFGWFVKITVKEEGFEEDILTYDPNLPLDKRDHSMSSSNIGEYSVFEENEIFYFYKDGELINTFEFTLGEFEDVNLYYGLALTTEKQLYMIYVDTENDLPTLKFYYIDKIDSLLGNTLTCKEQGIYVPIIIKDNKQYVAIPEDWEVYKLFGFSKTTFSVYSNKPNYSINLVELKNCFKKAIFEFSSLGYWSANVIFDLNGLEFSYKYSINGYDSDVEIPEEVIEKFEKTVTSKSEFWSNIESLREAYFDYYDHEGD